MIELRNLAFPNVVMGMARKSVTDRRVSDVNVAEERRIVGYDRRGTDHWDNDTNAMRFLEKGFNLSRGGIYSPKYNHKPTREEYSAIDYLCNEWDYGYDCETK